MSRGESEIIDFFNSWDYLQGIGTNRYEKGERKVRP
jgi:hypothetical protein